MRKILEISELQELIVDHIKEQHKDDRYMTASDLEYNINSTLGEIATLLVRMVTK